MFLINRILWYAQRYIYKLYPDIYLRLKQTGFEKLNQLQVVVVEKLFYKHFLKGCDATSNKRVECSCLLQVQNFFQYPCLIISNTKFTMNSFLHTIIFLFLLWQLFILQCFCNSLTNRLVSKTGLACKEIQVNLFNYLG